MIPVSAGIPPLPSGGHEDAASASLPLADPHTWLDPGNVVQWVENIEQVLVGLDIVSAVDYTKNTGQYLAELQELLAYAGEQIDRIPAERRKLVTNHDTFA